ncbi:MAG: TIGR03545 family protein [Pirellulales bacterium]|nr:TIGR03545 family protein [Pirellulales bacterium]
MIRWRFVITRLVVVIAVLVLLRWGLGPVVNYVTIGSLESITGAKVEIAQTRVGLFPPRVHYFDFAVADPRADKEMRDAFRAKSIDLVIDGEALLGRRWVANNGSITGVEIGAKRETSGHDAPQQDEEPVSASDSPSVLGRLLSAATDEMGRQAGAVADSLETVRRSQQIRARWEQQFDTLVSRARNLEKQIRAVRDEARGIENPLRDWPRLDRTLDQAKQARHELMSVRQAINALPEQLQADLARLDEAKKIDLARAEQFIPVDLNASGDFGIDMLTEAIQNQVQQIRGYLDNGRTLANYTVIAPESERGRGVTHDLELNKRPKVMVRRCEVGGLMRSNGVAYTMTGILENLTPTPQLLAEPTRARLRLEGPEVMRVEYVRDRRNGADVDLMTLHWPQTEAKPLRLGSPHDAGIAVQGGRRELWVQIKSEGDRLSGRLVSKQTGLSMNLSVPARYADTPAAQSLQASLAAVDRIEVDASFEGTWKDLDFRLQTNLGQVFRQATQDMIDGQIRASRAQLVAEINQAHLQQTQELRQWLNQRQSEARSLLVSADKSIEEMSQKVLDEVGDADAYLGKLRTAIRGRLE